MVDFSILLGLTPDGDDIARHIKGKRVKKLQRDADKISKKSDAYIGEVVNDTIKALGNKLRTADASSQNQAYLIGFVADLSGDASTNQLHYLIHDYHVGTDAIVDAFHTALGLGNRKRAINLVKAFPELLFQKVANDKNVYEHFTDDHWLELIKAGVMNFKFFKSLSDDQVVRVFRAMPRAKSLINDKSLLSMIRKREGARNKLLDYFDELVRNKDVKAEFIMKLASMPLTSCDSKGVRRIIKNSKSFTTAHNILAQLSSLEDISSISFLAELLSIIEIPETLEAYQLHIQIGKLLCSVDGLKHEILDHIKDPSKRHDHYESLEYCKDLYKKSNQK